MAQDSGFLERVFADARSTYQALADALPVSLLIKDTEGRRLFANKKYLELRGQSLGSILNKDDFDLFPVHLAASYVADDQVVIRSGEALHNIEETVSADGSPRWIERMKCPIKDSHGKVIGIQLMFWDVTERIAAEKELRHEQSLLKTLLDNIPDSIYFKDTESRFLRISNAMAKKFAMENASDVIGKNDSDIFTSEHALLARKDELRVMQSGEALVDRIERETWADREDTWCISTKMPFRDESGKIIGTFGISRDITELTKSQQQLREARDVATKANEAKSNFLANMSHEIRTPMNAIIGMSELLAQSDLTPEQRDYNTLVRDSADSLLRLLNEILDFSKIEANKLELESIPFSARDVIEKAGQTLSVKASEKNLELLCRIAPDVPSRLMGDPGRLRQVLVNLIGNAIKFTETGHIFVDVNTTDPVPTDHETERSNGKGESEDRQTLWLRFQVSDTGIGIPEDKIQSVLEAFTQADSSTTRRFGGTGLGLAISRQLIDLMKGKLEVESQVGKGTTFWFAAPFPVAAKQATPDRQLRQLAGTRVLIVDDNPVNRRILEEIFVVWGFKPTLVDGGKHALMRVREANDREQPFQLIVLDCMMPEMDGFELARRLRQQFPGDTARLIMLSSANLPDRSDQLRELDISRYLNKPVIQSELLDTIVQVLEVGPASDPPVQTPVNAVSPMRVLVAEDGLANQQVAIGMLKACGHKIKIANDGSEAVACWQKEPFDVILMDMHMPVMDGIEATKRIREQEKKFSPPRHIPIIALTAAAMQEDSDSCLSAGMDAFLTKPIHPRRLQETLARFADNPAGGCGKDKPAKDESVKQPGTADHDPAAEGVDAADGPQHDGRPDEQSQEDELPYDDGDVVDLRAAESRIPGGRRGVRRLAEVFIGECEMLMGILVNTVPDGDLAEIGRAAHTLKGSANLFYAHQVYGTAREIEQAAKEQRREDLVKLLEKLNAEAAAMLRVLRHIVAASSDSKST
ncbi:hybrid sensor histidine kinase/response regulator [Novipirellula caenicola]|uniref:histidine kinase n=1 Tax=Novipirellula caenicola TaxID=1536901 RepID=A0ABP9VPA9_9BACT